MRKRTVVIGVVILIVGGALFAGGAIGALASITINTTFSQPHPGEYVSAEIVLNSTSSLAVASPSPSGGIVHAQDLGALNSANIGSYAIPFNSTAAGADVYRSLRGDFYYVAFSATQPNTKIVATPERSSLLAFGALVLLGLALALVGIVVVVVGVVQKNRAPPANLP